MIITIKNFKIEVNDIFRPIYNIETGKWENIVTTLKEKLPNAITLLLLNNESIVYSINGDTIIIHPHKCSIDNLTLTIEIGYSYILGISQQNK